MASHPSLPCMISSAIRPQVHQQPSPSLYQNSLQNQMVSHGSNPRMTDSSLRHADVDAAGAVTVATEAGTGGSVEANAARIAAGESEAASAASGEDTVAAAASGEVERADVVTGAVVTVGTGLVGVVADVVCGLFLTQVKC